MERRSRSWIIASPSLATWAIVITNGALFLAPTADGPLDARAVLAWGGITNGTLARHDYARLLTAAFFLQSCSKVN